MNIGDKIMRQQYTYTSLLFIACILSQSILSSRYSALCCLLSVIGNKNNNVNKIPQDIEAKSSPYANQPITVAGTIINKYNFELNDKLDDFIC